MTENLLLLMLVGSVVGAAAGYLGSFMVLKRMSLVGDALSHVALPGIAIALALHAPPLAGAFVALFLAVLGIWYVQETSEIYPDALVGIFFTASLAVGILITPEPDLLEALFGNLQNISPLEGLLALVLSFALILITHFISRKLLLNIISPDLAKSVNVPNRLINFIYYLLIGTIVALGVKFVGTLLMGALVIIPAASAKNISRNMSGYYLWSIFFGIISALLGVLSASFWHISPGPLVVLSSVAIFITTYFIKSSK